MRGQRPTHRSPALRAKTAHGTSQSEAHRSSGCGCVPVQPPLSYDGGMETRNMKSVAHSAHRAQHDTGCPGGCSLSPQADAPCAPAAARQSGRGSASSKPCADGLHPCCAHGGQRCRVPGVSASRPPRAAPVAAESAAPTAGGPRRASGTAAQALPRPRAAALGGDDTTADEQSAASDALGPPPTPPAR